MIDRIKQAEQLERDAKIIVNLSSSLRGLQVAKAVADDLLGVSDYFLSKAESPDMHMKAEFLMQRMAQELQEILDDLEKAENDPMAGATIQALLDEHDAYWLETLEPDTEPDIECTPENLKQSATKALKASA